MVKKEKDVAVYLKAKSVIVDVAVYLNAKSVIVAVLLRTT